MRSAPVTTTDQPGGTASARPTDTTDLRVGPPVDDALLALLPLIGRWAGTGSGRAPGQGADFRFIQEIDFAHDGRPFVVYEARSWLVDVTGAVIRPAARESGFWRPGAGPDDVEVVLALNTGITLVLTGAAGDQRWDLASAAIGSSPTARDVTGHRRLYGIVGGALAYAQELAGAGQDYEPHLTARLERR